MESPNSNLLTEFSQRDFRPLREQFSPTIREKLETGCSLEHADGPMAFLVQFHPRIRYIRGNVENDEKCVIVLRYFCAKFQTFSIFVELKLGGFMESPRPNPSLKLM